MIRKSLPFLALLCAFGLRAEVLDSAAGGFTIKETLTIKASPQDVYKRFFQPGLWWNSKHTFSGDAKNLSIEERPGGCFCEKLPDGGGVKHFEVAVLMPGKAILLHGGMGPMLSMAVTGSMQIQLTPADGGTKVEVTYAVVGYLPAGMNTWATLVDGVVKEQFVRLKSWIENGAPSK